MGPVQGRASEPLRRSHVDVAGLTVRYGGWTALDGLDLGIGRGELFVLLGGSGSGKTTLLRTLAGFVAPAPGASRWAGATSPRCRRTAAR